MRFTLSLLILFSFFFCDAQEEIFLKNPSFEGFPKLSHTPSDWFDCGFPGESQVDIHPVPASEFQVNKVAVDGQSYLGMVTRENETWEAIGQRLSQPLIGGKTYSFSINLAQSATYISAISTPGLSTISQKINFSTPIKLKIWGGHGYCKKEELLAESPLIINTDWQDFSFTFQPKADFSYIVFEAFYKNPTLLPYNGNILLDNASSILEIDNEDFSSADSIKITRLISLEESAKKKQTINDERIDEKFVSHSKEPNKYKEGVFSDDDRTFLKKQLALVKFEPKSPYLEDKSIDAIIEIVKKLNLIDDELKISFSINAVETNWDKKRGKEILTLLTEAGIDRYRVTLRKYPPTTKPAYFRGGYEDVYMCIY